MSSVERKRRILRILQNMQAVCVFIKTVESNQGLSSSKNTKNHHKSGAYDVTDTIKWSLNAHAHIWCVPHKQLHILIFVGELLI